MAEITDSCPACGKPEGEHELMMAIEAVGTQADCSWVISVMEQEDWLKENVLPTFGIENVVSGSLVRKVAIALQEVISDREEEARKAGFDHGWSQCKDAYGVLEG